MFLVPGKASIVIDGQFGSTGKGLISGYLANQEPPDIAVSCAGPNAGHTYIDREKKIVAFHLPMSGILCRSAIVYLGPGAIIDPQILQQELDHYPHVSDRLIIHPRAAVIEGSDIANEKAPDSGTTRVASTAHGVGEALVRKIRREATLAGDHPALKRWAGVLELNRHLDSGNRVMIEVAQGWDLGINSGLAYPFTTSREVSVTQALADVQVHPSYLGKVMMTCRTYPIRVGNAQGYSGPFYGDSREITWEDLGVTPEMTTVTQRVRRVATFSHEQYDRAIRYLKPDFIFMNFMNYISGLANVETFLESLSRRPTHYGWGPSIDNIQVVL